MKYLTKFVLILFTVSFINASPRSFRLGRKRGGNVGVSFYSGPIEELPPAQWFEQKLDHFIPSDRRLWKQKYYMNDSFFDYNKPGPIFLMIGGEGPASPTWMVKGTWIEYAKYFKALCVQLEHRYYGESHPTENLSTKNLIYLTSHQALADLANFIEHMNKKLKLKENVQWVAFGGSYPGSLAAWLRLKYPHLVYAAVSSSGPLLAKVDFMEYYKVVVNALREKTGGEECVEEVKSAHKQIRHLMKNNPKLVEKEFKVCKPFSTATEIDVSNFYDSIANNFADLVQYNEDNRISADEKFKNVTINSVCSLLTEDGDRPAFKKLATFNSIMLEKNNETCLDYSYENMIAELRNDSYTAAEGGRQWMYQTCTEFGFYQTSSAEVEVFGDRFPLSFYIQQCQDVFGKNFDGEMVSQGVEWSNAAYGALDVDVSRVVFVHGSVDPWHALGRIDTASSDAPAVYIKGTAHCANMYPADEERDPPELNRARFEIREYLDEWLNLP